MPYLELLLFISFEQFSYQLLLGIISKFKNHAGSIIYSLPFHSWQSALDNLTIELRCFYTHPLLAGNHSLVFFAIYFVD
jgi:hypothetical protein